MNSELTVKTDSFKLYVSVGLCLTVIVVVLSFLFTAEMSVILYSIAGVISLSGAGFFYDRYSTIRHQRQMAQIELERQRQSLRCDIARADIVEAESRHAQFVAGIFTMSRTDRALVMSGVQYHVIDATSDIDRQTTQPLLPAPSMSLDLLRVFTQYNQCYALIGPQQSGKTFQARRIAQYWIDSGIKPWVIAPKWDVDEWAGCTLFGGGGNFVEVSRGLRQIRRLADERHASDLPHKQHPIQPIFLDDWTDICAELRQDAESFILKATTIYASVNIILYFIIHLDTAKAWGVDGIGAALKNNFYKLLIRVGTTDGLIDRSKNTGWLLLPGQTIKDARQVALFAGTGQPVALPVEPDLVISPRDQQDIEFVRLVQGGMSRNEASRTAYGRAYGGDLVERGKRALGEI